MSSRVIDHYIITEGMTNEAFMYIGDFYDICSYDPDRFVSLYLEKRQKDMSLHDFDYHSDSMHCDEEA